MPDWVLDAMAVCGTGLITGGVFVQFGLGYSLIACGAIVLGLAINAARLANVTD